MAQLANNEDIFKKCHNIFKNGETLMIFPEGSHDKKRAIRPLSKGFTRIVFGALEKYKNLDITVIPVGITYQHPSSYPCNVVINYGQPIAARPIFEANALAKSIVILKNEVSAQLKNLTVHITDNETYEATLQKLVAAQVDFTKITSVNSMIAKGVFPKKKTPQKNYLKPLLFLIKLNSIIPYLIWKNISLKIDEIEFIDTFRFSILLALHTVFYSIQTFIICTFFGNTTGFFYLTASILLVVLYSKFAPTNAKEHVALQTATR